MRSFLILVTAAMISVAGAVLWQHQLTWIERVAWIFVLVVNVSANAQLILTTRD